MNGATRYLGGPFGYGRFAPDHLVPPTPGAGSALSFALDARWSWRFVSVRFTLTTSASAANRLVTVDYCDPEGNVWVRNGAGLVITANTTAQEFDFTVGRTIAEWAANTPIFAPLADTFVPPGWLLKVNVANVQAADQIGSPLLYVEKFEVGRGGYEEARAPHAAGIGA